MKHDERRSYRERIDWLQSLIIHLPLKYAKRFSRDLHQLQQQSDEMWKFRNDTLKDSTIDNKLASLYSNPDFELFQCQSGLPMPGKACKKGFPRNNLRLCNNQRNRTSSLS